MIHSLWSLIKFTCSVYCITSPPRLLCKTALIGGYQAAATPGTITQPLGQAGGLISSFCAHLPSHLQQETTTQEISSFLLAMASLWVGAWDGPRRRLPREATANGGSHVTSN